MIPDSARPLTALALLADQDRNCPEGNGHGPLPVEIGAHISGLGGIPDLTRQAVVREVTSTATGLLDVSLIGASVMGWRDYLDLTSAARRTLVKPGSTELVHLATHQITSTRCPSVTILLDGHRLTTVQLGLSLVFDITAVLARIRAGLLVAPHSGRGDVTVTLAIEGTDVMTRRGHFELAGVIPFDRGIRLLAATAYAANAEHAPGGTRSRA
jgi:hypothetical protein